MEFKKTTQKGNETLQKRKTLNFIYIYIYKERMDLMDSKLRFTKVVGKRIETMETFSLLFPYCQ